MAYRLVSVAAFAALSPIAAAQISTVTQERSVASSVSLSSGSDDSDSAEAANAGPFVQTAAAGLSEPLGADGDATAAQNSTIGPALVTGTFTSHVNVRTGTNFVTAEADAQSNYLYIFSLAAPTQVQFTTSGQLAFVGQNPDGEPSDLYGSSSVRLLDSNTMDQIAGFSLFGEPGNDSAQFNGTLPAGQYVILANARAHAFSADLLGPPARSGSGDATATFSLEVVPAPAVSALLGLGALAASRRRR